MELEQKAFEDSKNRILAEFSADKDRLLKEIHQKEQELEFQREKLLKDKKEMAEHLNREFNEKVRMIEKRNQVSRVRFFLSKQNLFNQLNSDSLSFACTFFLRVQFIIDSDHKLKSVFFLSMRNLESSTCQCQCHRSKMYLMKIFHQNLISHIFLPGLRYLFRYRIFSPFLCVINQL